MLRYITKRIFFFIPTLFVITLLGFILSVNAPGDPVERMVTAVSSGGDIGAQNIALQEQKIKLKKQLGLDLPVFYFSVSNLATPDTLYRIYDKDEQYALNRLVDAYGNWDAINNYYKAVTELENATENLDVYTITQDSTERIALKKIYYEVFLEVKSLKTIYETDQADIKLNNIHKLFKNTKTPLQINKRLNQLSSFLSSVKNNSSKWKTYIPAIHFYGSNNQYHKWLFGNEGYTKGILKFDFGTSYNLKLPVADVIKNKISWSLFFSLLSILLAYMVSIPVGVRAAQKKDKVFDKFSSLLLFLLFSLPVFFAAFLLMLLFANPNILSILPASGIKPATGYPLDAGFMDKARITLPYLILPLICYTYSSFAFLSRTMRVAILENLEQDYIRTARAKGLSENKVVWKHALKNSLFPLITVFANIFPAAIGGSVIIESIFTIPGMGLEVFNAISSQDYPMIIAVMTLSGTLTLIGFLVSDILYALVDPRINYR